MGLRVPAAGIFLQSDPDPEQVSPYEDRRVSDAYRTLLDIREGSPI